MPEKDLLLLIVNDSDIRTVITVKPGMTWLELLTYPVHDFFFLMEFSNEPSHKIITVRILGNTESGTVAQRLSAYH